MKNNDTPAEGKSSAQTESESALRDAACSSSFCHTCGQPWPKEKKYKRIRKGTKVKHIKRGWIGHVFSYAQCEKGTCGVDFGEDGKWCESFRSLEIIETNSFINRPVALADEKRPNQNQETI